MAMNNYLLIITLNVNGLNAPIKRHRVAEWIRKYNPHICSVQETHIKQRSTQGESEGMEKIFQQMDMKRKLRKQYLYQTKKTSKQRP